MNRRLLLLGVFCFALSEMHLHAQVPLRTLKGFCHLSVAEDAEGFKFKLKRSDCESHRDCGETSTREPASAISGFTLADLEHEGAHGNAVLQAEAGRIECSGTVRDHVLSGDFTFVPDAAFVAPLDRMGFHDLDSEKLEAYSLFRIESAWIQSLQNSGVSDLDSSNLIALRIFGVDAAYIQAFKSLGYAVPDAGKLAGLKVQGVDPEQVQEIRAMGYQPTFDELIQMRIFKVTPDFIRRMQAKGFKDLTIQKLVQIRIFNLAE